MLSAFRVQWQDLERRGLVTRHGGRARLTREGLFLANEAFGSFVAPFAPSEEGEHPLCGDGGPLPAEEKP